MLVRGPPGVGKTTLVMELVRQLQGASTVLATRQVREDLIEQFPFLGAEPDSILGATDHMPRYTLRLEMLDLSDQFALFPQGIKRLHDHLASRPQHTTVIIDSWDAVIDQMRIQRAEFHRNWDHQDMELLLLETLRALGRNLVLVREQQEPSRLDYLSDGILVLDYHLLDGRRVRQLHWEKLRGVAVSQNHYSFSLGEGTIRCFSAQPHQQQALPLAGTWVGSGEEARLHTGCADLDRLLGGGLAPGSHVLLELSEKVSADLGLLLLGGPVVGTLGAGGGAFLLPSSGYDPRRLLSLLGQAVAPEHLAHLRLGVYAQHRDQPPLQEVLLSGASIEKDFEVLWDTVFALSHDTGGPLLTSIAYDTVEYLYGRENGLKVLGASVAYLRNLRAVGIDTIRPSVAIAQQLRDITDIHLRLEQFHGVTLLLGVKPRFRWQAVLPEVGPQGLTLRLQPMT